MRAEEMSQDAGYYPEVRKWVRFPSVGNYNMEMWQASFAIIERQNKNSHFAKVTDLFMKNHLPIWYIYLNYNSLSCANESRDWAQIKV